MAVLKLLMNKKLFLREPQDTSLGRKMVRESILMIDELGIEQFTFKKLAKHIGSTEASVYRYFENKHRLLIYLISWYWSWLEYKIDFSTQNIKDPKEKLKVAIELVAMQKQHDSSFPDIDEVVLSRIVVAESDKVYHTKQVDEENNDGLFRGFKSLCKLIASFVQEINPDYRFSHSLISTMLEAAHQQVFFARHLPALTELDRNDSKIDEQNTKFLTHLVFSAINQKNDA
ncbi:MAG: TetR/AcrR family transcriptional regulator [Fulvivirga sp.]